MKVQSGPRTSKNEKKALQGKREASVTPRLKRGRRESGLAHEPNSKSMGYVLRFEKIRLGGDLPSFRVMCILEI